MSTSATSTAPAQSNAAIVNTAKITGRRQLHFNTIDDIRAEAERLAVGPVRQLGNWSLGQTFSHLSSAMKLALDGASFRVPFYIRWIGPLIKKKMLRDPMKPGFQLPQNAADGLIPKSAVTTEQGLSELRTTIDRMHRESQRFPSPVFGKMSQKEWDQLHCRHAELHLSFFTPAQ